MIRPIVAGPQFQFVISRSMETSLSIHPRQYVVMGTCTGRSAALTAMKLCTSRGTTHLDLERDEFSWTNLANSRKKGKAVAPPSPPPPPRLVPRNPHKRSRSPATPHPASESPTVRASSPGRRNAGPILKDPVTIQVSLSLPLRLPIRNRRKAKVSFIAGWDSIGPPCMQTASPTVAGYSPPPARRTR